MLFDFDQINTKPESPSDVDPIKLFRNLKVKDASINDIWLAQAEALRPWDESRTLNDVAISLNTGAGKTLVGLLIAQSLVNETKGKVLYACNSIQLVEQTRDKAESYGLDVTTYFRGNFSNHLYSQGKAPCVTTYQALFNGKSRFFREEVEAVIFDDAHTAESVLRDSFSLSIKNSEFPSAYYALAAEFRDYFYKSGASSTFDELVNSDSPWTMLMPPFVVKEHFGPIYKILKDANLGGDDHDTKFAWEHVKDHLDHCSYVLSAGAITITPPLVPVRTLPYFQQDVRRVYLSATLDAKDGFTRTFGKLPDITIAPETSAGACERLILLPSLAKDSDSNDVGVTAGVIGKHKSLILCPTYRRGEVWCDVASAPEKSQVTQAVNDFKASPSNKKLLLTARYDGVDLPGDTCRLMVIDDLPSHTNPLENFLWEFLRMSSSMRTTIASRIVQCFGRISRGMSDHGVVMVTGANLVRWLSTSKNQEALPPFLQKQVKLGFILSEQISNHELEGVIDKALSRDPAWISNYEKFIGDNEVLPVSRDAELETRLAKSEAKFASAFWRRDYARAAQALSKTLEEARGLSVNTGAWHQYLIAMATEHAGETLEANAMYHAAHAAQSNLPAPLQNWAQDKSAEFPSQVLNAAKNFTEHPPGVIACSKRMDSEVAPLISKGSPSQVEEAMRVLGLLLGMQSSRPDKEHGTGPDNLWVNDTIAYCIDCKSDKLESSQYTKKDEVGQMLDHIEWVKENTACETIIPIFLGPRVKVSKQANPPRNLQVITVEDTGEFANLVLAAHRDIERSSIPLNLLPQISEVFSARQILGESFLELLSPIPIHQV